MATLTLTAYTVQVSCEISLMWFVRDCITWQDAKIKALREVQDNIEITFPTGEFELDWQQSALENATDYGDGDWNVCVSFEVFMNVPVVASDWQQASSKALEIAQNGLDFAHNDDTCLEWRKIKQDDVIVN